MQRVTASQRLYQECKAERKQGPLASAHGEAGLFTIMLLACYRRILPRADAGQHSRRHKLIFVLIDNVTVWINAAPCAGLPWHQGRGISLLPHCNPDPPITFQSVIQCVRADRQRADCARACLSTPDARVQFY